MITRIAVIGPGAIGGTVAAWLAQNADYEVSICARTPFERLVVRTPDGEITAAPRVLSEPAQAREVDWALICTKTYDSEPAAAWFGGLVGPATRVAVLQNGVEHVARFAPFVEKARIVPVVVDIPAERDGPGRVRQRRNGMMLAPAGENGAAFAALFSHAPIDVGVSDDFTSAAWRKLCINCAGAVNAITLKPAGVARNDGAAAVMRSLIEECAAVGRAEGAKLAETLAREVVEGYRNGPPDGINSLLADRLAGRRMELDARNGVIVRLGAKHGIAAPMNAALVALIEAAAA
jgi:2-dehydropantoate 2-reductase